MLKNLARTLTVLVLFGITACTTPSGPPLTAAQRLYQAHGNYNVALGLAVSYSESRFANPQIVHRLREVNDVAAPAFRYAEAFIACAGTSAMPDAVAMAANVRCQGLDLSAAARARNAGMLTSAVSQISSLLRSAMTQRLLGGG